MKLVRFTHPELGLRVGMLEDDEKTIAVLPQNFRCVSECIGHVPASPGGVRIQVDSATLLAPFASLPRNIFCIGKNYRAHAQEFSSSGYESASAAADTDSHPAVFTKPFSTIAGPGEVIDLHAAITDSVDYEGEVALVIGRSGRNIRKADAWDHIWGYLIVNDLTARDLQRNHKQWFMGKALDGFCPMGPFVATADEIEAENLELRTWVNGELRQSANTNDLLFDIPTLIETLSAGITLLPGDIISTGTPAGVGLGFDPPKFLRDGDTVSISVSGLGTLTNSFSNNPAAGEGA